MKRKHENIIEEIKLLTSLKEFSADDYNDVISKFSYDGIIHYLNSLFQGSKPETATADLLAAVAENLLNKKIFKEVAVKGGFGDAAFRETIINPVIIELKPLFTKHGNKFLMYKFDYVNHEKQVQKYLQDNQYVILTNLDDAYLFGREAMVKYEPFTKVSFVQVLDMFSKTDSLWDSIRRLEDTTPKVDLEKEFFGNLKKWYEELQQVNFIDSLPLSKEEAIVLLLNKIIFIKTLEDYGLIPFRFLEELYFEKRNKWETKGEVKVFKEFFDDLEEWFYVYYDTELFSTKIWDYIHKDYTNLESFRNKFESVLGLGVWNYTFGKGMIHYNYRQIDEDVFGKAYETFLAESRKDEGIYYTPKAITEYMAQRIVHALFKSVYESIIACIDKNDFDNAWKFFSEMQQIKIADTCSGSGSFLIKVLRNIYGYYYLLMKKTDGYERYSESSNGELMFEEAPKYISDGRAFRKKCNFNDRRKLISSIILHHIYAVDIDERALETAKTNMWKEAVKLEPPVFNFRKLPRDANHILPNLAINFINGDALYDLNINESVEYLSSNHRNEIIELQKIRTEYISNPSQPDVIDTIKAIKQTIREQLEKTLPLRKPVLAALEFYFLFFDEEGNALPPEQRGFNGIISNPPWEAVKPISKEFAKIGKGEMDVLGFKKWFAGELKSNEDFKTKWNEYVAFYRTYNAFLSQRYQYQGSGDPNLYKLLTERNLELICKDGYLDILIPSGIQTDYGGSDLRKLILEECNLLELSSFENRGYNETINGIKHTIHLFPDIDSRFKFSVLFIQKQSMPFTTFNAKFYMLNPAELKDKEAIAYDTEMIKRFSPQNLSVMEFRSNADYLLCTKIRSTYKLMSDLKFEWRSELHMTNNSDLFIADNNKAENLIPLFEGKMIHQYHSQFADARYWVDENAAFKELSGRDIYRIKAEYAVERSEIEKLYKNNNLKPDFYYSRLAYRAIGRSTDERTMMCSIIPQKAVIGHSMNYLVPQKFIVKDDLIRTEDLPYEDVFYLMALMNSLVLNYYMRNKISANLTMNFVYELPIPSPSKKLKKQIIELAFTVFIYKNNMLLFEDLQNKLNVKTNDDLSEIDARAMLEKLIAFDLFKLTQDEWKHLASTFHYGSDSETKKELDEIIRGAN